MDTVDFEQRRLLALRRYGLLDSPPEAIFDGITVAIANICQVPIALVSLVDAERQWFKSCYGLRQKETPRDIAFCDHAISEPDELLIVEDAIADPRFESNPLVTQAPHIRFYAGRPIVTGDGFPLGTLCVIDRKPRQLEAYQLAALEALSSTVSAILDERYRLQKVAIDRDSFESVLSENVERYEHLYEDAESLLSGVLQRDPAAAVVINRIGTIVSCNDAWTWFAETNRWKNCHKGDNYLDACQHESAPFGDSRHTAMRGIRNVLKGQTDRFQLEFAGIEGDCALQADSISRPARGALIQHTVTTIN